MGGSSSKGRGFWPFASGSTGGGDSSSGAAAANGGSDHSLARFRLCRPGVTPFVFTRKSSMFFDEDGDLAHEFYEETFFTKNGRRKAKLKRVSKNLIPQGMVKLDHPRIHVDFPVVLCEV